MKTTFYSLALSGLLLAGAAAYAQTDNSAQQTTTNPSTATEQSAPSGRHMHRAQDPDRQIAIMSKHLKLTADQQSQIKPILEDRAQQMQALRADKSTPRADKMAKFKSIRDDSNQKIEAVLNDTQKQKFEAMQQKHEQRMQEHMKKQQDDSNAATPQG